LDVASAKLFAALLNQKHSPDVRVHNVPSQRAQHFLAVVGRRLNIASFGTALGVRNLPAKVMWETSLQYVLTKRTATTPLQLSDGFSCLKASSILRTKPAHCAETPSTTTKLRVPVPRWSLRG
jgi:hypothetical protein